MLWGRKTNATWWTAFGSLVLVVVCPLWVVFIWISLEYHNGSVYEAAMSIWNQGLYDFCLKYGPRSSINTFMGYAAWVTFQGLLYTLLPGPVSTGQMTPGGNLLEYKTNGLLAWGVTHGIVLVAGTLRVIDMAIVSNHWMGLFVAANLYGILLAGFCQIKAHISPSYPNDRKFSGNAFCTYKFLTANRHAGSLIFDYFVGIELNPRFGKFWDFKLFHNGRPGIIAWTLM